MHKCTYMWRVYVCVRMYVCVSPRNRAATFSLPSVVFKGNVKTINQPHSTADISCLPRAQAQAVLGS